MFGDTTTIRALARRLRERADEIRDLAAALTAGAREVAWQGVAADAMRTHVETRVLALHRTARLHEDAADALDRHAREVDLVKDLVDEAKDAVQDAAKGTIGRLKELL
jgi:methyl-accepting chemotaxis protein